MNIPFTTPLSCRNNALPFPLRGFAPSREAFLFSKRNQGSAQLVILSLIALLVIAGMLFFAMNKRKPTGSCTSPNEPSVTNAQAATPSTPAPKKVPLPPDLLLSSAPASSQWVVAFTYPDKNAPAASSEGGFGRVKKITATRSGPVVYEEIIDEAGNKMEKWYTNNEQYTRKMGSVEYFSARSNDFSNVNYAYHSPTGFQGFDWISKKNFAGIEKVDGRECMVYRDRKDLQAVLAPDLFTFLEAMRREQPKSAGEPTGTPGAVTAVVACIDQETRLPVSLQLGEETRTFTFLDPPRVPVALPEELKQQLEQRQKAWNQLIRAAPRH